MVGGVLTGIFYLNKLIGLYNHRRIAGTEKFPVGNPGNMQTICRYTASQRYTVVRTWT